MFLRSNSVREINLCRIYEEYALMVIAESFAESSGLGIMEQRRVQLAFFVLALVLLLVVVVAGQKCLRRALPN